MYGHNESLYLVGSEVKSSTATLKEQDCNVVIFNEARYEAFHTRNESSRLHSNRISTRVFGILTGAIKKRTLLHTYLSVCIIEIKLRINLPT